MAKAFEELDEGDLEQASEKGWGAAAKIVKAIADERGWGHHTHRDLYDAVDNLVKETGDNELVTLFIVASSLHTNFYENWYPREFVASGIRQVERFVDKVEPILTPAA